MNVSHSSWFMSLPGIVAVLLLVGNNGRLNAELIVNWSGNFLEQSENGSFNRMYRGGHLSQEPTVISGIDVNSDGEITEETKVFWEFDISDKTLNPLSADDPRNITGNASTYNTELPHAEFYGGIRVQYVNMDFSQGRGFGQAHIRVENFRGENLPSDPETVITLLPFGEAPEPDDLMNFHAVFLWPTVPAEFNEASRIGVTLTRWLMPKGEARFVVMDGDKLYIAEPTLANNGALQNDSGVYNRREISPLEVKWALYSPKAPDHINFDQKAAVFKPHVFKNIRMAGIYFEHDAFVQDPNKDGKFFNLGFKCIEFKVDAVVLPNKPPKLHPIDNQIVEEGESLTFTATAIDPNEPASKLKYSLDSGAPEGAAIDPDTGIFTWTPSEAQGPGYYQMTIRVTDNGVPKLDHFHMFTVSVKEVNSPPELESIGKLTIQKGMSVNFTAKAKDTDLPENKLTFYLDEEAPEGAGIDPITGVFRWTPDSSIQTGDHEITIRVTDDGVKNLEDSEKFTVYCTD